ILRQRPPPCVSVLAVARSTENVHGPIEIASRSERPSVRAQALESRSANNALPPSQALRDDDVVRRVRESTECATGRKLHPTLLHVQEPSADEAAGTRRAALGRESASRR